MNCSLCINILSSYTVVYSLYVLPALECITDVGNIRIETIITCCSNNFLPHSSFFMKGLTRPDLKSKSNLQVFNCLCMHHQK